MGPVYAAPVGAYPPRVRDERAGAPGLLEALRHRSFALMWTGQTVSMLGDGIFTVALAVEALAVDRSPSGLAAVLAARMVPTLALLLLGGVVVDRAPRRLLMLGSDAVRGIAVGVIAVLVGAHSITLGALIAMAVVFGIADAFFTPASVALVPELLPGDLLVQANALSSLSRGFAQVLVGQAVGGVIVATTGTGWSFAVDAASFGLSAASLLAIRAAPRVRAVAGGGRDLRRAWSDVREGLRYCRGQPWLWASLAGAGLANFAIYSPLGVLVPLLVRDVLHRGAVTLGLVLAARGTGLIAAAWFGGRRGLPRRPVAAMWTGWTTASLAAACSGLAPDPWTLGALIAVATALLAYGNLVWTPLMQRLVPDRLLGRVSSVDTLSSLGLSPLGIAAAGGLAAAIGTRATLLVGGAVATAAAGCLLIPGVRDPDRAT
jgi:Transmembrane secretion effector